MKTLSLTLGVGALLVVGGLATTAKAGERDVRAHVSIELPFLSVPAPIVRPVAVVPASHYGPRYEYEPRYQPRYEQQGRYDERRRERWEHRALRREFRREHDRDVVTTRFDRDGDGVPNRYDRRPNNPYRY